MSMVEVDPKLFITCRLCLEESGTYQIIPSVQEQINYCFGIQVEPFDGLPQLICKKCQANLVVYTNIKQHFVLKQEELRDKIKNTNIQQNETKKTSKAIEQKRRKSSTLSNGTENSRKSCNKVKASKVQSKYSVTKKDWESEYRKTFACRICNSHWLTWGSVMAHQTKHKALKLKHANIFKSHCSVPLPKIDNNLNLTGSVDKVVYSKQKIFAKGNQDYYIAYEYTGKTSDNSSDEESSTNRSNKRSKIDDSSDSSSNDIAVRAKQRRRIFSSSSSETVVLENESNASHNTIENKIKIENDCISIDDTDSETDNKMKQDKTNKNDGIENAVSKLIASTLSKFHKNHETSTKQPQSSMVLQRRKILSVGRKIIYTQGMNSQSVLKYLEHANLNMIWISRCPRNITPSTNLLKIATRVRISSENNINDFEGYQKKYEKSENTPNHANIETSVIETAVPLEQVSQELDALQSLLTKETSSIQANLRETSIMQPNRKESAIVHHSDEQSATANSSVNKEQPQAAVQTVSNGIPHKTPFALCVTTESDAAMLYSTTSNDTQKILNSNPVANPKQLPKKFNSDTKSGKKGKSAHGMHSLENDLTPAVAHSGHEKEMPMPVITFTTSLAVPQAEVSKNNKAQSHINKNNNTVNNNTPRGGQSSTQIPRIKVKAVTELMSKETLSRMSQSTNTAQNTQNQRNQTQNNNTIEVDGTSQLSNTTQPVITNVRSISAPDLIEDFVILDTVELPNTKTPSPFKYFKMLLQLHCIILLDTDVNLSEDFHMLIRFKVLYKQETKEQPVILCLSLFCAKNVFCLRIKDRYDDSINMRKISANWQWEILKIYRGEVVAKLLSNAEKISKEVHDYTNRFLSLLKSINFVSHSI